MQNPSGHFEQPDRIEQRSAHEALRLRKLADALGIKREWLLQKARQCEAARASRYHPGERSTSGQEKVQSSE
jgi:hypothetical protein